MRYATGWTNRRRTAHSHALFLIVQGQMRFDYDGQRTLLTPGTALLLPCGVTYQATAVTDCDYFYLHFYAPDPRCLAEGETAIALAGQPPAGPSVTLPAAPDELLVPSPTAAPETLTYLFSRLGELADSSAPLDCLNRDLLISRILLALAETSGAYAVAPPENATYTQLRRYVLEHFSEPLTLSSLADHFGLSRQYVARLFRQYAGQSTTDFINACRLRRALALLRFTPLNVSEIAFATGFSSAAYFTRLFHRVWGMTPSEYKAQMPD